MYTDSIIWWRVDPAHNLPATIWLSRIEEYRQEHRSLMVPVAVKAKQATNANKQALSILAGQFRLRTPRSRRSVPNSCKQLHRYFFTLDLSGTTAQWLHHSADSPARRSHLLGPPMQMPPFGP